MVRATWLSANLKSRHGLRGRRRRNVVAPGGNRAGGVVDQLLHQQRHEQFAVRSHALALSSSSYFGRCPNWAGDLKRLNTNSTCQRRRYHSSTSAAEKGGSGKVVKTIMYSANRRVAEGRRLHLVPLAGSVAADFLVRQADGFGGLAAHADPARNLARRASVVARRRDRGRPGADRARTRDRRHCGQQVERPPARRVTEAATRPDGSRPAHGDTWLRAHSRFPGHALTPTGVMAIRCKQFHLPDL